MSGITVGGQDNVREVVLGSGVSATFVGDGVLKVSATAVSATASGTVAGPGALGDATAAGSATSMSKGDHFHGLPTAAAVANAVGIYTGTADPTAGGGVAHTQAAAIYLRNNAGTAEIWTTTGATATAWVHLVSA